MPAQTGRAWLSAHGDGLRAAVRVTPRATRSEVKGIEVDAAGEAYLAVRVKPPPDGGRANQELVKLLAKRWRVPAQDLSLVTGATGRRKLLHVAGDPARLLETVRALEEDRQPEEALR